MHDDECTGCDFKLNLTLDLYPGTGTESESVFRRQGLRACVTATVATLFNTNKADPITPAEHNAEAVAGEEQQPHVAHAPPHGNVQLLRRPIAGIGMGRVARDRGPACVIIPTFSGGHMAPAVRRARARRHGHAGDTARAQLDAGQVHC